MTFTASEAVGLCGIDSTEEDGHKLRSSFNEDLTKVFVTFKDAASEAKVIGYYEADSPEFHQLSVAGDQFTDVDHRCPSYHAAGKRIYFWDYSGGKGQPTLASMPEAGGPVQVETALQEPLDFSDSFFMADSQAPVVLAYDRDTVANDAGTLAATVAYDGVKIGPAGDPIQLANAPVMKFVNLDPSLKFNRPPSAIGFVSDNSIVFTDGQQIWRADVRDGQAVVSLLLATNVDNREIFNVTISSYKQSVAFLYRKGTTTTLYTVPITGGGPQEVTQFNKQVVKILQFNN